MKTSDRGTIMKKKIVSGIIICVILALSVWYSHVDKNQYLYDRNLDTSMFVSTGILTEDKSVTQEFVSKENTIDGINIKVNLVGNSDESVIKYVLSEKGGKTVYEGQVFGRNLKNSKFNKLPVEGVSNAKNEQYTLTLTEQNADEHNGIGFYIDTDGTLIVRMISYKFDIETFAMLLVIIIFFSLFMKMLYKLFK